MLVMKFGGTSVGSAEAIKRVAEIVQSRIDQDPMVVVSAVGGMTNKFVELSKAAADKDRDTAAKLMDFILSKHRHIVFELGINNEQLFSPVMKIANGMLNDAVENIFNTDKMTKELYDALLSIGEYYTSNILSAVLRQAGIDSVMVDSRKVLKTDSNFSAARPLFSESKDNVDALIKPLLGKSVPIIQGFIGSDAQNRTTTLGRGGSDFSATLYGAMLGCETVEIWSDVDGVLTADPSIVDDAGRIRYMTFKEAAELAYFGAKVLHPATLLPAIEYDMNVVVLNSMNSDFVGTTIANRKPDNLNEEGRIKSIAYKEGLTVITVESSRMLMAHGFMALLFSIFEKYETPVDLVVTSEVSVSLTIDNPINLDKIICELQRFADVKAENDKAIVCLVGEALKSTPGIPGQIMGMLQDIKIYLISQGASEINFSFVIDEKDLPNTITTLHDRFFKQN